MTKMYHYTECGLDNVWLTNGVVERNTAYGKTTAIKNINALHGLIGTTIAHSPESIRGQEVRFLRTELDWSQNRLARTLEVKELTVGRWERGETRVPGPARMALSLLYIAYKQVPKITELVNELAALDRQKFSEKLTFLLKEDTWVAKEAA